MTDLELLNELKYYRDEVKKMGLSEYAINGMNSIIKYAEDLINIELQKMADIMEGEND